MKYCSVSCKDKDHSRVMAGHYVSEETRKKMSDNAKARGLGKISGPDHPNWKGGVGSENTRIRTSIEYVKWRKSVFKRDLWTCQHCGTVGGNLHAHHIFSFSKYKSVRFVTSNGITLCEPCHSEVHGRNIGRKVKYG